MSFLCADFVIAADNHSFADSLIILGKSQFEQGHSTHASYLLLRAEKAAVETNNLDQLKQIYILLGAIYENEGEFQKASAYYKKLSTISEKIAGQKIKDAYVSDQVILLDEHHEQLQQLQLKRRDNLIIFFITLLAVIITFIVFFIIHTRRKKLKLESVIDTQTRDLQKKNIELKDEIQKKLREEEKFKSIFNTSTQSIFVHDAKTLQIVDINDCACETYGYSKEEMLKLQVEDLSSSSMYSLNSPAAQVFMKKLYQGEIVKVEWEAKKKDGTLFWQDIHAKIAIIDGQERLLIFARNIDEKKKVQKELEESKRLLQSIIHNLPIACYAYDLEGRIILQSNLSKQQWGNLVGGKPEEISFMGHKVDNVLLKKWNTWRDEAFKGLQINDVYSIESDQEKKYFSAKIIPLKREEQIIGILGMDIDITEIKQNEKKLMDLKDDLQDMVEAEIEKRKIQQELLVQKSKLESLGQLAAGIAHEINQPIGLISLGIDNINERIKSKQEISREYLKEKIDKFFTYLERIRQIIDHIGTFSRDQKDITYDEIEVNAVVSEALSMIQTQYEIHDIHFNISYGEELPLILGNRFKLEQVVLNLLSNARDAIERKFTEGKEGQKLISISTYHRKNKVLLKITDNGIGIAKKDIGHIFEPFYTTKEPDKGTGLGLSVSYGIIEEMKAEVEVDSKPAVYTTFILKFKAISH